MGQWGTDVGVNVRRVLRKGYRSKRLRNLGKSICGDTGRRTRAGVRVDKWEDQGSRDVDEVDGGCLSSARGGSDRDGYWYSSLDQE